MRNRDPAYSLHAENYTVPLPNASVGCPTVALPLGARKHRDARNRPTLKRFRYFKGRPRNRVCEPTRISCVCKMPNRPSNLHVILPQQGEVIWVPVVIADQDNHGNSILFQRLLQVQCRSASTALSEGCNDRQGHS